MNQIFESNIKIINLRFPDIYKEIERVDSNNSYLKIEISKKLCYTIH